MIIQSAAVLEAVKARPGNAGVRLYGGATADLDSLCARRHPKSWSGRKKAAVEQKKAPKQERKRERKRRRVERALTTSRSYKVFGRRNDGLSTRSEGRRPKSAKAGNRGLGTAAVPQLWGFRRGLRRRCGGTWRQGGQFF